MKSEDDSKILNDRTFESFKVVIDRIEGEFAVCEMPDLSMIDINLSLIPGLAKESDSLLIKISESNQIEVLSIIPFKPKGKLKIRPKFVRFS